MPCQHVEITDAVGNEPNQEGTPGNIRVTGHVFLDCDQTERVEVWLSLDDDRRTARVEADFELNSFGQRTGNWNATLHDFSDRADPTNKYLVECRKTNFSANAECIHGADVVRNTIRRFEFLWCCPWNVVLEVRRADGTVLEGVNSVYADLNPGNYVVRVVEPPEPSTGEAVTYQWFVDDHLQGGQTAREFVYTLDEGAAARIRVDLTQSGCRTVPGLVTLMTPVPMACPEDVHITEKSISICHDGTRTAVLEGEVINASVGMRLEWSFGDGNPGQEFEIQINDIDDQGVVRSTVEHDYSPGEYTVSLFVLAVDGSRADACPHGSYRLRVKPCPDTTDDDGRQQGTDGRGDGGGSPCWLALLVLSLALIIVFGFLAFSPCIPYALVVSGVALIVMVIAVIFAAVLCDRCRIFRALAWAIWWAIFIGGLPGMLACPLGAIPVVTVLAIIQAIVIAAINSIDGCRVPVPWEFPFCREVNRRFGEFPKN